MNTRFDERGGGDEAADAAGQRVFTDRLFNLAPGRKEYVWSATAELKAGYYVLSLSSAGRLIGSTRFLYGH